MSRTDLAPPRDLYLPEYLYEQEQDALDLRDLETLAGVAEFLSLTPGGATSLAPHTWEETLTRAAAESAHRSKDWTGRCQEFCRTMPGCPSGAGSASAAWFAMPDAARVVGGNPAEVKDEPGWQHFSRSLDPDSPAFIFGHVIIGARPFGDGKQSAWSTDARRLGYPDRINPNDLYAEWNHEYLGRGRWQNGLWLDVRDPKPVQDQPYRALGDALVHIDKARVKAKIARETAKAAGDSADVKRIHADVVLLNTAYRKIKDHHETLRRAA